MAYLINEMIFLLLATACVSALLGRFLCKSNERAAFADKKQCQSELTQVQKQRDAWEIRSHQWQQKFAAMDDKLASQEHETKHLELQLAASETERETLLIEIKKNDVCKAKLESMTEELKSCQTQLHISLKKQEQAEKKIALLSESNTTLEEALNQHKQQLLQAAEKQKAFKVHCHALNHSNQELKKTESSYYQLQQSHAELNQEYQKLRRENTQLHSNQQGLAKLQADYQKLLEDSKDLAALRKHVKQLTSERNALYQEAQQLQHELEVVGAAHEEQSQILHKLMSQRDDFLSRLHAVSSVVGAMGIGSDTDA